MLIHILHKVYGGAYPSSIHNKLYIHIQKHLSFHTKSNSTKIKKIIKKQNLRKGQVKKRCKMSLERDVRLKLLFGLVSIKFNLIQLEKWHW